MVREINVIERLEKFVSNINALFDWPRMCGTNRGKMMSFH